MGKQQQLSVDNSTAGQFGAIRTSTGVVSVSPVRLNIVVIVMVDIPVRDIPVSEKETILTQALRHQY